METRVKISLVFHILYLLELKPTTNQEKLNFFFVFLSNENGKVGMNFPFYQMKKKMLNVLLNIKKIIINIF